MRDAFRSLRSKKFRLFFIGQTISLIGTWMQRIALPYYIYRTTNSPSLLGLTDFLGQVPALFLGMIGGIVADRFNRKKLFLTTQVLALIQAVLLAMFTNTDHPVVPVIILLGFFLGVINSFDMPTRNALVPLMLENKEDISNAIAIIGMMVNIARILGSSIGGFVIEHFGEYMCFIFNAVSFLFVIITLFFIDIREEKIIKSNSLIKDLKEIIIFVSKNKNILITFALFVITNLLAMPFAVTMTIFARDILHQSAKTLGLILGVIGIGAMVSGMFLASLKNVDLIGKLIPIPALIIGSSYLIIAFFPYTYTTFIASLLLGMSLTASILLTNTFIQLSVPEFLRGRMMGIYTSLFIGIAPIGSLIIGLSTEHIGIINTVDLIGFTVLMSGIIGSFLIFKKVGEEHD